ncbi:hypothetical protein KBC54_00020 [Patescibacteria group bacterium]|nr:hypothetical protein [Patescibacteria group bacterium]
MMKNDELPFRVSMAQKLLFVVLVFVPMIYHTSSLWVEAPFIYWIFGAYLCSWIGPVWYLRLRGMRSDWVRFYVIEDVMTVFSIAMIILFLKLHLPLHWYIVLVILFLVLEIPLARRILKLFHPNSV